MAVGGAPTAFTDDTSGRLGRLAASILYRLLRVFVGGMASIVSFLLVAMVLPSLGACPAGGGDITGGFGRFTFITYAWILSLLLVDFKAK